VNEEIRGCVAPRIEELPQALHRAREPVVRVGLRTTTPIYGGGVRTRRVDPVDVIRVPGVRGQLRWWWRALFAGGYESSQALFEAERQRWGGIGAKEQRRSAIVVAVEVRSDAEPYVPNRPHQGDTGYVLWPARPDKKQPVAAECWPAGLELELRISILGGDVDQAVLADEAHDCVQAWILFGGYGGRTRRGLGSLTVVDDERSVWLPTSAKPEAIGKLFRRARPFAASERFVCDEEIPRLGAAKLYSDHAPTPNAQAAWIRAVDWLRQFRQGVGSGAREPGRWAQLAPDRHGRSNWPEPDKVRRLAAGDDEQWEHRPRHDGEPAWPRAGFGLPIVGRFQDQAPDGTKYVEPPPYWLKWSDRGGTHERLASPLVLKAMGLANGSFVPIALWLDRAFPRQGRVVLGFGTRPALVGSAAPFDRLCAPGDSPFTLLAGHSSLRDAFFAWLPKYRPEKTRRERNGPRGAKGPRSRGQGGHRR
jgi:CRISPR-associated protein Cmr1